jgi:hypothetical protein
MQRDAPTENPPSTVCPTPCRATPPLQKVCQGRLLRKAPSVPATKELR